VIGLTGLMQSGKTNRHIAMKNGSPPNSAMKTEKIEGGCLVRA
jgi:hypothetical protein